MEKTDNGINYEWFVSGPDGAHFILYPSKTDTKEIINAAKAELRRDRDVLSIKTVRL